MTQVTEEGEVALLETRRGGAVVALWLLATSRRRARGMGGL